MDKKTKILIAVVSIPILALLHVFIQYLLINLFVTWGYSETPPPKAVMLPFQILGFCLNPITPLVGYLDANIIRVKDYWYYVSAIAIALTWASFLTWLVIHKINKKSANQRMESTR